MAKPAIVRKILRKHEEIKQFVMRQVSMTEVEHTAALTHQNCSCEVCVKYAAYIDVRSIVDKWERRNDKPK
jgi:hypothetical protein